MTKRRPLALGAAAALGLGSLFIASPALAQNAEGPEVEIQDPVVAAETAADAIAEKKGDDSVVGYASTTAGDPIVLVNEELEGDSEAIEKIAAEEGVEKLALVSPAVPDASTDVVGGAGYMGFDSVAQGNYACSTGFSGFDPEGNPAIITAGHCASDGAITDVELTLPSNEPAVDPGNDGFTGMADLGTFGFAQYGGPGNSAGAEGDPSSTDIAVIDVTNDELDLLPAVTDWSTAGDDDLAASSTPIKAVADPVSGTVSKSGRTTGLNSGSTELNLLYTDGNTYPTEILDGYMVIGDRYVHGFLGGALTEGGDSGGAVFQGENAVGVVSGGPSEAPAQGDDWAWYTRLNDALQFTDGYTVALDIDAPEVSIADGDTIAAGSNITITAPANATEIGIGTSPASGETLPVEDGSVTIEAPAEGDYTYTFTANNGFSRSDSVEISFSTVEPLESPTFESVDAVTEPGSSSYSGFLKGTGLPGATVTVDDFFEVPVADDGTWELEFSFGIGDYTMTAVQELEGKVSQPVEASIYVAPAAPTDLSIEAGSSFANGSAPTEISGQGISGADINVSVNGTEVNGAQAQAVVDAVGDDGAWTETLGDTSAAGTYAVEVTQTHSGVTSAPVSTTFTVEAAAGSGGSGSGGGGAAADPTNPSDPSAPTEPGEELPVTGAEIDMLPFALTAGALLLIGGGAVVLVARRMKATEEV